MGSGGAARRGRAAGRGLGRACGTAAGTGGGAATSSGTCGVAIGSGGSYAQSAARALLENTDLAPREIVTKSLEIAGDICIYTNRNFTIETLE